MRGFGRGCVMRLSRGPDQGRDACWSVQDAAQETFTGGARDRGWGTRLDARDAAPAAGARIYRMPERSAPDAARRDTERERGAH